jgi:Leu/Phe-tRNA-protein transferase
MTIQQSVRVLLDQIINSLFEDYKPGLIPFIQDKHPILWRKIEKAERR